MVGDQLFVVKKGGISASFDPVSGETQWVKKRVNNFGNYYASPIAGDGKIYVMGENGFLVVLQEGKEMKILAKNDLGEPSRSTPAVAGGKMFLRTDSQLFCVGGISAEGPSIRTGKKP